ncbi:MAG: hypothetical protein WCF07_06005 [Nitrososphaeraceae archaeon]
MKKSRDYRFAIQVMNGWFKKICLVPIRNIMRILWILAFTEYAIPDTLNIIEKT